MQNNNFLNRANELEEKLLAFNDYIQNKNLNMKSKELIFDFAAYCEVLVSKINTFYTKDSETDEYIKMSVQDKDDLLKTYNQVSESIQKIQNNKEISKNASDVFETANFINNYISDDIRTLVKIDKEVVLPEAIEETRTKELEVSENQISTVTGNMTRRLLINQDGKQSIFTENNNVTKQQILDRMKEKYIKGCPKYKEFYKNLCDATSCKYMLSISYNLEYDENGVPNLPRGELKVKNPALYDLLDSKGSFKALAKFRKDPDFYASLIAFSKDAKLVDNVQAFYEDQLKLNKKDPIDERNSGMSVVAELLGYKHLMVHTEPAKLKINGITKTGNLMDFAVGKDIYNLKPDDIMNKMGTVDFEKNGDFKKQLADLQVLDYICGNQDRHSGNIFFQVTDKGVPTGIMGIDNDCSFPETDEHHMYGCGTTPGYANLNVISESMANKMKSITPAMFEYSLKGLKISDKAQKLALKRFTILQNMLNDPTRCNVAHNMRGLVKNPLDRCKEKTAKINIIPDNDWANFTIPGLNNVNQEMKHYKTGTCHSVWHFLTELPKELQEKKKESKKQAENKQIEKFNFEYQLNGSTFKFEEWSNKLKSATSLIRGSSEAYDNVKEHLLAFAEKGKDPGFDLNEQGMDKYKAAVNAIRGEVQTYLKGKEDLSREGVVHNSYTQKRIDLMNELDAFLATTIPDLELSKNNYDKANQKFTERKEDIRDFENKEAIRKLEKEQKKQQNLENHKSNRVHKRKEIIKEQENPTILNKGNK